MIVVSIIALLAALAGAVYFLLVWPIAAIHAIIRWWRGRRGPGQML